MGSRDKFAADYQKVITGLAALRRSTGMTQVKMAAEIGVDQTQISKFERGERRMDIIDFVRYCNALGSEPGIVLTSLLAD